MRARNVHHSPGAELPKPCPTLLARTPRGARSRRGVLLLVVLSLLVLFILIAVTFVLVAGQYRRSSRAAGRAEQYGDDPQKQIDEIFGQVVRDTLNGNSVLQQHSLLNDMYGNDGLAGTISNVKPVAPTGTAVASTPFADLTAGSLAYYLLPPTANPGSAPYATPGYFNGCVLTMTSGLAMNQSMRIVGWSASGMNATIRVLLPDGFNVANIGNLTGNFIINGRPFNGTGFGLDVNAGPTAATLLQAGTTIGGQQYYYALLPNGKFYATPYAPIAAIGGADEDYDAPDPQNMILGYMPGRTAAPPNANLPISPTNPTPIIPSLHRPDLLNYYLASGGLSNLGANTTLLREILMRPIGPMQTTVNGTAQTLAAGAADHPNFTGSNPGNPNSAGMFDPINGPWDVDNDGDGFADSVWVDFGAPAQTAPDGRRFKPLAAILCLDLDGRLNVNAHGSIAHIPNTTAYPLPKSPQYNFAGAPDASRLTPGQGYGTAEINLNPLLTVSGGNLPALLAARYTEPNSNSLNSTNYTTSPYTAPFPGITNWDDWLSAIKSTDYATSLAPNIPSSFGSPPDLWGRGYLALDLRGMPLTPYMGNAADTTDDPYELNLSRASVRSAISPLTPMNAVATPSATPAPFDAPFTPVELERILRLYDIDAAALPYRLLNVLGANAANVRNAVSSESFDLPSPGIRPTRDLIQAAKLPQVNITTPFVSVHVSDMLRVRLLANNVPVANIPIAIQRMLPPEVIAGQKMDLNRPFGNGRDDDGNYVVDEPNETDPSSNPGPMWNNANENAPSGYLNIPPNLTNGIDVNFNGKVTGPQAGAVTDAMLCRQLYARHLYTLMMLLLDQGTYIDFNNDGRLSQQETAQGIAQWAINVVDFRDSDSIMTPFEYDIYPFGANPTGGNPATSYGWDVDGDITTTTGTESTERGVVWGCERPELLITETLAFHDRRSEDLSSEAVDTPAGWKPALGTDSVAGTTGGTAPAKDRDFDQRLRPRGSFFVELYNPWNTMGSLNNNGPPLASEISGEFYTPFAGGNPSGVNLATPTNGSIWRLIVVGGGSQNVDPDGPALYPNPSPVFNKGDVERAVYFANPAGVTDLPNAINYYPSIAPAPIYPGRYGVVGSAGQTGLNNLSTSPPTYVNTIGRVVGGTDGVSANTRQIVLMPQNNPTVNQVAVLNNLSPSAPDASPPDIQPAIAIVADNAWDGTTSTSYSFANWPNLTMNISEPLRGYTLPAGISFTQGSANGEGAFSSTIDVPLDYLNPILTAGGNPLKNGRFTNFRNVHLQRLANPLLPWNAVSNPYLTVDSMPVDLVLFNGVWNPATSTDPDAGAPPAVLAAYQRGDSNTATYQVPAPSYFWGRQPPSAPNVTGTSAKPGISNHNLNLTLQNSLGGLNTGAFGNVGYGQSFGRSPPTPLPAYVGGPKNTPFPWLTWNNRPYIGPVELMLVPKSSSSQLLGDYFTGISPYVVSNPTLVPSGVNETQQLNFGGHLLDFYQTAPVGSQSAHFYRLLDYVQVPSRFVGTDTQISPQAFNTPLGGAPDPAELSMAAMFHPPFNKVSNYRDPGRVNINTIPSNDSSNANSMVWDGIQNAPANFLLQPGPSWSAVFQSRQLGAATGPVPSQFSSPFRSAAGAALGLPMASGSIVNNERDATLLRLSPASGAPLFYYIPQMQPGDDPNVNPYFRFQPLQRLSNLLTTRSNVYAIWITVGYFEVTPIAISPIYPDGYQLGQELYSDTGDVRRHRAFYIFDRSIPVGFEPGHDHNIDRATLIKRFIE